MRRERWIQIDELFHLALKRVPSERMAFLSEACGTDASLRSEVEALLSADGNAGSFLEGGPGRVKTTLESGSQQGAYRIGALLGRGGMGEVYRAEDTRLAREVAIKVLPWLPSATTRSQHHDGDASNGEARDVPLWRRFENEALLAARIQHPAVVPIYERGQLPGGEPFYSMKLVSGRSLSELIGESKSLADRLALLPNVIAVADALAHAHSRRILHRDVKPANIIIGEFGETVLIDWGVAKNLGAEADELPRGAVGDEADRTALGTIIGTPAYMSPEQARGLPADERADVFSLGATLYHLLAGQTAYEGDTPAILPRVAQGEYVSLSEKLPDVPPELAAIVDKAMAREAAERYPSARELAEDLRRFQTGQLVLSHRYSTRELLGRWAKRHRPLLFATAAFIAVAAVSGAIGVGRIIAERDRANREAEASQRVSQFMAEMFKLSDPSQTNGNSVTAREILDKASKQIESGLSNDKAVQARLMHTMAEVYYRLGLYPQASELAEKAVELRRKLFGPDHLDTVSSLGVLGNVQRKQGRAAAAAETHRQVLEILRRVRGPEHPETLQTMVRLANVESDQAHYDEAETLFRTAIDIQRRVLGSKHPDTVLSMSSLAVVKRRQGQYAEAESLNRQLLAIQPDTARHMINLALVLVDQGKYDEAERLDREAFDIHRRILGPDHADTVLTMLNLANLELLRGEYGPAADLTQQALEKSRRVLGPAHPYTLASMHLLAENEYALGHFAEAEKRYREVLADRRRVHGPGHPATIESMSGLGKLLLAMKKMADSEQLSREMIEISRRVLGPKHRQTLSSMSFLAEVTSAQGRQADAEKLCWEALDAQRQVLGPEHVDTLLTQTTLANIYARQGRYEESEKLQRETLAISERTLGSRHPRVGLGFYGLGRLAVRQGDPKKALDYLRQAIDRGLSPGDVKLMHEDKELTPLRGNPEFGTLIAEGKKRTQ